MEYPDHPSDTPPPAEDDHGNLQATVELQDILPLIGDKDAHEAVAKKFLNRDHHARAILRAVYDDKRKRQQDEFSDLVYSENYGSETLARRPFINFGPGSFRQKYWRTADKIYSANGGKLWSESRGKGFREKIDYEWDMYRKQPIEIEEGALEIVYASHIVEHAYDEDNDFFFRDVLRILKPGGIFRLTAPNIDLGLRAAQSGDYTYYGLSQFLRGGRHRRNVFGTADERLPIEWFVIENCSLLVRKENSTYLTPEQCRKFLWSSPDVYATLSKASVLSDRGLNERVAAHVNWFNPEKIARMLKSAGFRSIIPSAYGQSISAVLRDTRYFDNTNPLVSWYVDAIK